MAQKNSIYKTWLMALVCTVAPHIASAVVDRDTAQWNISVTPQNLINNFLRTDFEHRLGSYDWIGLGTDYFFGAITTASSDYGPLSTVVKYNTSHKTDRISGAGLIIEDKLFFDPWRSGYHGGYFTCGASYTRLNIAYQDNNWVPYQQYGNSYYGFAPTNGSLDITRIGAYVAMGYAIYISPTFHFDVNFGGGLLTSSANYVGLPAGYRNYTNGIFDYQYSGIYPLLNFQLGVLF